MNQAGGDDNRLIVAEGACHPLPTATLPEGSAGLPRYRTYDAQTETYRGYDGVVRPCRPM
jgi:hypothetical protein